MNGKAFIDTNIYVYTQRSDDPAKTRISKMAIDKFECISSTQVLNETSNIFINKYPMPHEKLIAFIDAIIATSTVSIISITTVKDALEISRKYKISYYDSLMIAAALENNCELFLSEDMQDGQIILDKLKIVNIFKHTKLVAED
ncbi:MAG: PIN domain-containing protein [Spirochaetia bacterium]|jgi:predicted nucleic acid-binding protein|nr:PIN domain-containing protein [Spirochaetia bacterium]